MSKIEFEIKGIGKLINENYLSVPIYQRPFAWEERHVYALLQDIKDSFNSEDYFLGTIVLTESEDKSSNLEIIDGQQRITSIVIFIRALLEYIDDIKSKNNLESDYICKYDGRKKDVIEKLKLSQQDNDFYNGFIIRKDFSLEAKRESHVRLKTAFDVCNRYIIKLLKDNDNDINVLYDWIEFISNKLKTVIITVPSSSNAFTIFETLNDRGLELAQVDLIKNYLYSRASERLPEAQNSWIELASKIEIAEGESVLLNYIKHQWSSRYGFTREKNRELFKRIKEEIKNSTQVIVYINLLKNDINSYLALSNSKSSFWDDYDNLCKNYIDVLNYFGLEQYKPLALSIIKKFSKSEVKKSFKLLVSWLVRNTIVGSMGGGTLEQAYAERARDIFEGKITDAKSLRESLKDLIPADEKFQEGFNIATASKFKYARYYLSAIENYNRGKDNPELIVNTNPDAVNLEHILPQNPSDKWSTFTEEELNLYVNRIGNMTIMKTKENNDFKNSSFDEKKKTYEKSEIELTKNITKYTKWTKDTIAERQKELSKLAAITWNLNFD